MFGLFQKKEVRIGNANFQFIMDMFDSLISDKFKCNRNSMVNKGEIFYFNGQNGSQFDWFENGHTSTLATLYPNGTEAVKIHIYPDGTVRAYYYKKGSMEPDDELSMEIDKETAKQIAVSLYSVSDGKGLFDKKLSMLDLNYNITDKDTDDFTNYEIEGE